jgi:nitroimidazol reductase NimA-like FMN-containing flavoprotein (pyridoxamine 5'-phosphate oxidase superfamily)
VPVYGDYRQASGDDSHSGRGSFAETIVSMFRVLVKFFVDRQNCSLRKTRLFAVYRQSPASRAYRSTIRPAIMFPMGSYIPTPRTTVRRLAKRGVYDRDAVHAILDEAFICHVAFNIDGAPVIIPTGYGRQGEQLYLHGAAANRMLKTMAGGIEVSVAVTLLDGLVLARSAFHHSMNYRSVVLFGTARPIRDPAEKSEALRCISDHIAPGRWNEVRLPTDKELKATSVLALPLEEVSAKVRTGGPIDDEEDYGLPIWAGVLPLAMAARPPIPDARLAEGIAVSQSVLNWKRL